MNNNRVCKNCGSPLPNEGVVCKFCGVMMNKDQYDEQVKTNGREQEKLKLLSEKYGTHQNIEYSKVKENKLTGLLIVLGVLLFLMVLVIIISMG